MPNFDAFPPPWLGSPPRANQPIERIEPTLEEARNGWDAESLTAYVAERRAMQDTGIGAAKRRPRPQWANGSTWHWRRSLRWRV